MLDGERSLPHDRQFADYEEIAGYVDDGLYPQSCPQCVPRRPCYHLLRGLGVWQPSDNTEPLLAFYTRATPLLAFGCALAFLLLDLIHAENSKILSRVGEILNSACTTIDLICPFLFCKYYFCYCGSYDTIMADVVKLPGRCVRRVVWLSRIYTLAMTIMWIGCGVFFFFHWISFFSRPWHYAVYGIALFYATGWWATWLSIYGFVCAVHSVQSYDFVDKLKTKLSGSDRTGKSESRLTVQLLSRYNELQSMLDSTQNDLGNIISLAVIYHVVDIAIFSYAYWSQDFRKAYPVWQYAGGISYDLISIFAKLYPAGIVSRATHKIAKEAALHCKPFDPSEKEPRWMPDQRLTLYHHLVVREEHMGLRILGVKISLGFAIGLIVTIVTTAASLLRFAVPHMGGL